MTEVAGVLKGVIRSKDYEIKCLGGVKVSCVLIVELDRSVKFLNCELVVKEQSDFVVFDTMQAKVHIHGF